MPFCSCRMSCPFPAQDLHVRSFSTFLTSMPGHRSTFSTQIMNNDGMSSFSLLRHCLGFWQLLQDFSKLITISYIGTTRWHNSPIPSFCKNAVIMRRNIARVSGNWQADRRKPECTQTSSFSVIFQNLCHSLNVPEYVHHR